MKSIFLNAIAATSLLFSAACGKVESGKNENTGSKFDGKEYITVSGSGLDTSGSGLSGSGSVVFKSPLGEAGSDKNFRLTFSLSEGGALDLVTHSDETLQNGNTVRLQRSASALQVILADKNGTTEARTLKNIDATGTITLLVDVHNSETPAHILIWNDGQENPDDDNSLFNSDADATAPGRGFGNFWGLSLNKASVVSASVQEAVFGH